MFKQVKAAKQARGQKVDVSIALHDPFVQLPPGQSLLDVSMIYLLGYKRTALQYHPKPPRVVPRSGNLLRY